LEDEVSDVIDLSLPAGADLLVLARLTAATIASRAGFDVEEIEDLRLAVDELCVSLLQEGADGRLNLAFTRDENLVEVSCIFASASTSNGVRGGSGVLQGLSAQILDALVDEHGRENEAGNDRAWLRKRRSRQED
jgi:serine/threonine-protein kinase RsbW